MKGLLSAGLLALLQAMTAAHAYEADIHYSTTYVLARAVGWTQADALTIASANQAVDENLHTVAALELNTAPGLSRAGHVMSSLHQARKNLSFHCFSAMPGEAGRISADVLEVMAGHFAGVARRADDPRQHARRLIALGAALHCQQDAFAHADFGGSCGEHSGSCYGHTTENLLDQVVFRLLGTHRYNPDHPGVSGEWLPDALRGTVRELAVHRPGGSSRSIASDELNALSDALRASGLELPDDVRRECNRHVAGKWLFEVWRTDGGRQGNPESVEKLPPDVAVTCGNASLASATVVRIPDARYPRLNPDASPSLVRADGSYQVMRDEDFHGSVPGSNHPARGIKVQLSHWNQILALPFLRRAGTLDVDWYLD